MSRVTFDSTEHRYTIDGTPAPSVTQVLVNTGLIDLTWMNAKAADRGTAVHEIIELIEKGIITEANERLDGIDADLVGYIAAWLDFKHSVTWEMEASELMVANTGTHRYCGTCDLVGTLNGVQVMIDIKTGPPQEWHGMQLAAYRNALWIVGEDGETHTNLYRQAKPRNLYLKKNGTYALADRFRITKTGAPIRYEDPVWLNAWKLQLQFHATTAGVA